MKYLNLKDSKRRANFWLNETERLRLKSLSRNYSLPPSIRLSYRLKLSRIPKNFSSVRVKNRCRIVCRSQSVYKFFRLNRSSIRTALGSNLLFGIRKSSW
jgi:small subunit ribosomal protein S14